MPRRRTPLPLAVIDELWSHLAGIYGEDWEPAEPKREWARRLAGFPTRALRRGVNACLHCGDRTPPTLAVFRRRCLRGIEADRPELRYFPPVSPAERVRGARVLAKLIADLRRAA